MGLVELNTYRDLKQNNVPGVPQSQIQGGVPGVHSQDDTVCQAAVRGQTQVVGDMMGMEVQQCMMGAGQVSQGRK